MVDVLNDRSIEGVRAGFVQFADTVFSPAPLYRRLALGVAEEPALLDLAVATQVGQYPGYVLLAAVHYLLFEDPQEPLADYYPTLRASPLPPEDAWLRFREFCARHEARLRELVSTRMVQTNEVGRTAVLAPAFAHVLRLSGGRPLHLIDVGAAAGLNLLFDRYCIDYGRFTWGEAASTVRLGCELRGDRTPPIEGWAAKVGHRVGVDLNPIDVTVSTEARWLRALVWADRPGWAEVLSAAMAVAAQERPTVLRGDAAELLPSLLGAVTAAETACVYATYAVEYFSEGGRARFRQALDDFGARRELYYIEMSGPGENGRLGLASWREGRREEVQLADCPAHGQWLRWLV